jgi:hypothetical protein
MNTVETMETQLRQQEIAARAFHLWEQTGHHHHRDLEVWLQAEAALGAALPPGRAEESAFELMHASLEEAEMLAPAW